MTMNPNFRLSPVVSAVRYMLFELAFKKEKHR